MSLFDCELDGRYPSSFVPGAGTKLGPYAPPKGAAPAGAGAAPAGFAGSVPGGGGAAEGSTGSGVCERPAEATRVTAAANPQHHHRGVDAISSAVRMAGKS